MRAALGVLFSAALLVGPAFSQSRDDPAAYFTAADIVFDGRLEKIAPSPAGKTSSFSVMAVFKGKENAAKVLEAQMPGESRCHRLEVEHRYLVYARKVGDQLWVDPCQGSKLLSQAEPDLSYIHTVNSKVSQQCSAAKLKQLAKRSPIVVTATVVGTEDSLNTPAQALFYRPWCGIVFSTESAYYDIQEAMKGQIPGTRIAVEHLICWDTITVDGYYPRLSPELFREGNVLLLFLREESIRSDPVLPPFTSGYVDVDENCGAVMADGDAARSTISAMRDQR